MKNPTILLALGLLLIAGSIGYEYLVPQPDEQATTTTINQTTPATTASPTPVAEKKPNILTYVPADSILFFGGLEPSNLQDMLKIAMPENASWLQEIDWSKDINNVNPVEGQEKPEPPPPAARMFIGMVAEYMEAIKTPETAAQTLGIKEAFENAFYTVGAIPVARFSLLDATQFLAFLDQAESKGQVTHTAETLDSLTLRTYKFDEKEDPTKPNLELVITTHENYGVITFAIPEDNRSDLLKQALGLEKPSPSLADTNDLVQLKEKYNFHPSYLGFINHKEIVNGLTKPESNRFGSMIEGFIKASMSNKDANLEGEAQEHPLANIQTPACQKELSAISDSWPRSVMGYTKIDLKQKPARLDALGVIEVNDNELLSDLKSLRGYTPQHLHKVDGSTAFGLGLGFNMDALLPFLTKTFQNILQTPYECEPLMMMKQQLAASNGSAAIGMVSGMLATLQGVSASVFEIDGSFDMETKQPDIKNIDAMLTLSAGNPQMFMMMMSSTVPPLASLQIPEDGTAIDLPLPLPIPLEESFKLAIKGNHIVAYIGNKGKQHADNLVNAPFESNSLFALNIDYGKYMKLLSIGANEASKDPENQENQKELEALSKAMGSINTYMNQVMDISDHGIEIKANSVIH